MYNKNGTESEKTGSINQCAITAGLSLLAFLQHTCKKYMGYTVFRPNALGNYLTGTSHMIVSTKQFVYQSNFASGTLKQEGEEED